MEPPPGGPTDTQKPYVAGALPAPDTTRVGQDLDVRVKFSEWVGQDIERGKVYLVPPLTKKIRPKLSGDELRVTSAGRLDTNTTYVLGVLGTVKDLNGQPLEAPLELAFSTGATLDSGKLQGSVVPFQSKPAAGSFAALYPRGADLRARFQHLTHRNDSVVVPAPQPDPLKEKPAYIAAADSLGRFAFTHLRPGRYGLLGFQDVNGDLNPNVGTEALGIGPSVDIAAAPAPVQSLSLAPYDTVPLRLISARWAHEALVQGKTLGTVRLKLSKAPHPTQVLRRESYAIRKADAAGKPAGAALPVLEVCLNPVSGEVELATLPLDRDSQYVASCPGLRDSYGNLADTAKNSAAFEADTARDTAKAEIVFLGPQRVSGEIPRQPPERFLPSRGLNAYYPRLMTDSMQAWLRNNLVIKADTVNVAFTLMRQSPHEFSLRFPEIPLKGQRFSIALKIDTAALKADTAKKGLGAAPGTGANPRTAGINAAGAGGHGNPGSTPPPAAQPPMTAPAAAPSAQTPAAAPSTQAPTTAGTPSGQAPAAGTAPGAPAKPMAPPPPPTTPVASFTVLDAAKLGGLKFKQDRTAYGSRIILRALGMPWETSRTTPSADEVTLDSLPEGFYAVDYFRDSNGDGIWHPGSLAPWAVAEPYVQWADSVEVKAGGVNRGDGKRPGAGRQKAPADTSGVPERKLSWPPAW